jgi:hypothetical protein
MLEGAYSVDRVTPRRPIIRSRNFRPCFLYASDPARRKASQIRAVLCPSRSAISSISFFRFDCTLKLRRVSFLIEQILALCRSRQFRKNLLTQEGKNVILLVPICHPLLQQKGEAMRARPQRALTKQNLKIAKKRWPDLNRSSIQALKLLTEANALSIANGDLILLDASWYVTNTGLLRLARRGRCVGMHIEPVSEFSQPLQARWAFKATVFKSAACRGFVGFGDADPSNVSPLVHGAEMRVAETRAVNRASARPTGSASAPSRKSGPSPNHRNPPASRRSSRHNPQMERKPRRPQGPRSSLPDYSQHQLNPNLVKAYATDFCGVKTLRDATREQVENFVAHLADWAEKDRNALLCQLNSYPSQKEGAA